MKQSQVRRAIAVIVLIGGVVAIFAVDLARQREQTGEHARGWVGGQWDVARDCLVGTALRADDEEAIARRLEEKLLEALIELESGEPTWPARCAPILASLESVDRSVMRHDPGDALAQLVVLAPRVLGDRPVDVRESAARARELAGPIAALDRAMPAGVAHPRRDAGDGAGALLASFGCDEPPAPECPPDDRAPASAVVACDGSTRAYAVRDRGVWRGALCGDDCAALPPLEAGDGLRLVIAGARVLAITPGARSDLTFGRVLSSGRWSEPRPIARGPIVSSARGLLLHTCDRVLVSEDAIVWRADPLPAR